MREQCFMKAVFHGVLAEDVVFPFPELGAEERENLELMLDSVRRFLATKVDAAAIDKRHEIGAEVLAEAKALGLFGLQIAGEHGGLGLSATAYSRVMQEVGAHDASLAVTLGAHQSIGLKAILLYGTAEQKRRFLPSLASGERVAAFALTEPVAGSDAAAIKTRADLAPDGSHYVLNGSKLWITNGGFADVFTVFARTSDFETQKPKLTAFLVERGEGVRHGPNEHKLGIRGSSTTSVYFDDVKVPVANVVGEVGRGFRVAMEVLNSGRLGLAAGCTGSCRALVKLAVERVQERHAFGRRIGEFGLIKDKIALMLAQTYALESATYLTTGLVDAGVTDYSLESAICKVFGSETLWWVVNETLQIAAGIGYMGDYPYERMLRDARINLIFEGTNEILRCFIALAGMAGPGQKLAEVARAMREPIKGFGLLRDFAIGKARSMLVPERLTRAHPVLSREAVIVEEFTAILARHVENTLRKHGRDIAEMQYVQRRVADTAIDLYALSACIARATRAIEKHGEEGARRPIEWTRIFGALARKRLKHNADEFEANDDELRKESAARAYGDGGYVLDIL
ncbi:MAG: acyl-CoA dehydrogenase family protein [Myxococcales bacterium]|nr:acyl-CoA dehydrogenase family protein [Myxococcales bacterium]